MNRSARATSRYKPRVRRVRARRLRGRGAARAKAAPSNEPEAHALLHDAERREHFVENALADFEAADLREREPHRGMNPKRTRYFTTQYGANATSRTRAPTSRPGKCARQSRNGQATH